MTDLEIACQIAVAQARRNRRGAVPTWRRDIPIRDGSVIADLEFIHGEAFAFARTWAVFRHIEPINAPAFSQLAGFEIYAGSERSRDKLIARFALQLTGRMGQSAAWKHPDQVTSRKRDRQQARHRLEAFGPVVIAEIAGNPDAVIEGAKISGHCAVCGRALTDPVSLSRGIGPECFEDSVLVVRDLPFVEASPLVIMDEVLK